MRTPSMFIVSITPLSTTTSTSSLVTESRMPPKQTSLCRDFPSKRLFGASRHKNSQTDTKMEDRGLNRCEKQEERNFEEA
eukprot:378802-Rhodomonas_salina.1